MIKHASKKFVEHHGYDYGVLILPVLSVSKPSRNNTQRVVFDWGKSISHPNAHIAFGMLATIEGQYFPHIIINENKYIVHNIMNCRSGRKAAIVSKDGPASLFDMGLIKKALAQEFPQI
jgi:hypothetical protein